MAQSYIETKNYGNSWLRGEFESALAIPLYTTIPAVSTITTNSPEGLVVIQTSDDTLQWYSNGAWHAPAGSGTVTSVGISSSDITIGGTNPVTTAGTITLTLPATGVTAGSYTNASITVDAKGRVTAASSGSGVGTVTSVDVSGGTTGLTASGGPIITSGTITLAGTLALANGGTGASLTASLGGIVFSTASALSVLAGAGVNSRMLLSGPSNPVWSTATIPPSGGGFPNKLLYSDGTNYLISTPAFPVTASATARKILVSDGTDWVASTETYAVPGTSGNVMTSNGTNWTSAAGFTNPMTTAGDMIYESSGTTAVRLPIGIDRQILTVQPSGLPAWEGPLTISSGFGISVTGSYPNFTVATSGSTGTVTSVSVASANGFSATTATPTTTPLITLTCSINSPILAGNGTAISAATTTGTGSTAVLATNPVIAKPEVDAYWGAIASYSPAAAATATCTLATYNKHYITMPAGNITIALSGETTGQCFLIAITQDGGGSRTVTWFSTIRWAGGSAPTLTTTGSKRDVFGFIVTGSATYDGFIIGQNL